MTDQAQVERLLGQAVFLLWADLPREVQETIFEKAARQDAVVRNDLAIHLHRHHPRSAHPAKPIAG